MTDPPPSRVDLPSFGGGRPMGYRLVGRRPVPMRGMEELEAAFADKKRRVGIDYVGVFKISTVFLVADHNFGDGPPVLFESMVFVRTTPVNQTERGLVRYWGDHKARYETWEDAEQGHREIVDALRASLKVKDPKAAIVLFDARITKAIRGLVRR